MHTYAHGQEEDSSLRYCYVVRKEKLKHAEMKTSILSSDSIKKKYGDQPEKFVSEYWGLKGFINNYSPKRK